MKKVFVIIASALSIGAFAQQEGQFSQYMINYYMINPAASGTEEFTDLKMSVRTQWVGLKDAPVNYYLSGHTPIGKIHKDNKRQRNREPDKPHQGVGGFINGQKTGPLSHLGVYASYSYHLPVSKTGFLSFGGAFGAKQYMVDKGALDWGGTTGTTDTDPAVANSTRINPDGSLGLWYYSNHVFGGISSAQLFGNKIGFSEASIGKKGSLDRHYFITSGYRFKPTKDFSVIPSVLLKYVSPAPLQIDLNCKVRYRDLFWAGMSYRKTDGIVLLAGVIINDRIEFGYSYDATTSNIRRFSAGTHEIVIGYRIVKDPRFYCPSDFW